jgi:hypothetical protein
MKSERRHTSRATDVPQDLSIPQEATAIPEPGGRRSDPVRI